MLADSLMQSNYRKYESERTANRHEDVCVLLWKLTLTSNLIFVRVNSTGRKIQIQTSMATI